MKPEIKFGYVWDKSSMIALSVGVLIDGSMIIPRELQGNNPEVEDVDVYYKKPMLTMGVDLRF